jgi:hypothetical protein
MIPCHQHPDYKGPGVPDRDAIHCAGAAIFRANAGYDKYLTHLAVARMAGDAEKVFQTPAELIAHHSGMPVVICEAVVTPGVVDVLAREEVRRFRDGEFYEQRKDAGVPGDVLDVPVPQGQ